jgi:hypothetical protein
MAREFFTGGIMPSLGLLRRFDDDLAITAEWQVDGRHAARASSAGGCSFSRAELFGFRGGRAWLVARYLLRPRQRTPP